jgi:hypothetical protein
MADNKTVSFQFKLRVALDVAQAMNFLHQNGVWHRGTDMTNHLLWLVTHNYLFIKILSLTMY